MSESQISEFDVSVQARNIGGIDEAEITLSPGVTVLTGRNATNRTSFLQAIMAGLGSERATVKGGTEKGDVELQIDDRTYTRTLIRQGDTVKYSGDPYLEDASLADQFAFLLENTEVRRAVARGEDLRENIMKPVNTEQIEAEISQLEAEKRDIDEEIEDLERLEHELPDLKAEKHDLEEDLEEAKTELTEVESEIDARDLSLERSRSQQEEMEDALEQIQEAQSELENLEFELETERETLKELQDDRKEYESRLEEMNELDDDPERLAGRIEELRNRKRSLNETVGQLGNVINYNEDMLDGEGFDLVELDKGSKDDPTKKLLQDNEETVCWTCGSEVNRERIETMIDRLQDLRAEKLDERNDLNDRIEDLSTTRSEIEQRRRERERIKNRLSETKLEIEETQERTKSLEASLVNQRDKVEQLEAETEEVGSGDEYQEVLNLHLQSNKIELRIERLEDDLADIEERIAECEAARDERSDLVSRREEVNEELLDLRNRVDRIEEEAVDQFNDHMESVLEVLEYENIDRIWIERRQRKVREGRKKVEETTFDLHIVRSTGDGTSYQDTVDHLSESEREVTGLVFALAGYLVYEVYEELPFMILDSLEAIDSERIARIVDYFSDYVDYLTVALLHEDAEALPEEYTYVEQTG